MNKIPNINLKFHSKFPFSNAETKVYVFILPSKGNELK